MNGRNIGSLLIASTLFSFQGYSKEDVDASKTDTNAPKKLIELRVDEKSFVEKFARKSVFELDKSFGDRYWGPLSGVDFYTDSRINQKKEIDTLGMSALERGAGEAFWRTFFDHAPLGMNVKDAVYGLRDDLFDWKKGRLDSTATYRDASNVKISERRRIVAGVDLMRRNPNVYTRVAGIDSADIALRASTDGINAVVYKDISPNWRISAGANTPYSDLGSPGLHFALQGKVFGGTFMIGTEFEFTNEERKYERHLIEGGYGKVLAGWNKRL